MVRLERTIQWKVRRYDMHAIFFLVRYVSTVRQIFEVRYVQIFNVQHRTAILAHR